MQARIRRLHSDHEQVSRLFAEHPFVRIVASEGEPPEKYTFEIRVRGLVPDGEEAPPRPGLVHRAEVFLPLDYPRRPPFCRMITPVFHPNIDPQKICIGDHWSAGQSLALMVTRIAEMICFQSYNVKSPLNAEAAAWAEQNVDLLPLHRGDLSIGL
jgi:ubiquitin-protein ligase